MRGGMLAGALVIAMLNVAASPDLSSPTAAAKSVYQATEAQDAEALRAILYAQTAEERELRDGFVNVVLAGRALADAAKAKFGNAAGPLGVKMMGQQELADIDHAEVKIEGDQATLTVPNSPTPVRFKHVNNQWQLMIANTPDAAAGSDAAAQLAVIKSITEAITDISQQIKDGRFATPHEAQVALSRRGNEAMIAAANLAASAATQPQGNGKGGGMTTQPTTRPAPEP